MIFIEIGAHHGQSLEVALNPKYAFKQFILFEPSSEANKYLKLFKDPRIKIFHFGLSDKDEETELINSGAVGASIFPNKFNGKILPKEKISLKNASRILGPFLYEQKVFIRINCEGSEVSILQDLLKSKLLNANHSILVDFDIIRFNPSFSIKSLLKKLSKSKVRYYQGDHFKEKYTKASVREWLEFELKNQMAKVKFKQRVSYIFKTYYPLRRRVYKLISEFIPIKIKSILFRIIYRK